jgi:hypothetical protein
MNRDARERVGHPRGTGSAEGSERREIRTTRQAFSLPDNHVCRLELTLDRATNGLTVAPLPDINDAPTVPST